MDTEILILFITGCVGGIVAGMFGIGGGVIYVVVFQTYLEKKGISLGDDTLVVHLTLFNSIFAIFFGALSGCFSQIRIKNFHWNEVILTAIPAVISSLILTYFIGRWEGYDKRVFLILFTIFLLPVLLKVLPDKSKVENLDVPDHWFSITGLLTGACTALTGLGGGIVANPILHGIFRYPVKRTFSISQGVMLSTTFFISIYHFVFNDIDKNSSLAGSWHGIIWKMTLPVILGVTIFAPLGVRTAQKLETKWLQWAFVIFSLAIIIRNLWHIFV